MRVRFSKNKSRVHILKVHYCTLISIASQVLCREKHPRPYTADVFDSADTITRSSKRVLGVHTLENRIKTYGADCENTMA